MLSNNSKIKELLYENAVSKLASIRKISLSESARAISVMSFSDYLSLLEATADIIPPSGQQVGQQPNVVSAATTPTQPQLTTPPSQKTVQVVPQVQGEEQEDEVTEDTSAFSNTYNRGDKVDTPLGTGTIVDVSPDVNVSCKVHVKLDDPSRAGEDGKYKDTYTFTTDMLTRMQSPEIARMKQLAGIKEDSSAGASCAGAIATVATPLKGVQRRQPVDESPKQEYTPTVAKTIIGDTKPNQATGKLSANLAAAGKKTASRNKNGLRR